MAWWNLLSTYEVVQIVVSPTSPVIALVLAWVAYSGFKEIRKDRKLRLIDRKLHSVYNPLAFIINRELQDARVIKDGKLGISKESSNQIKDITNKYAYFLEDDILQLFLEFGSILRHKDYPDLEFVDESKFDFLYEELMGRTGILRKQLGELAKD